LQKYVSEGSELGPGADAGAWDQGWVARGLDSATFLYRVSEIRQPHTVIYSKEVEFE